MKASEIAKLLDGEVVCGREYLDRDVYTACAADMMSDVLAYVKDQAVLVTGLCNVQTIRTAQMMDMVCIVFVRNKKPDAAMVKLAEERQLILITAKQTMFGACAVLSQAGLKAGG